MLGVGIWGPFVAVWEELGSRWGLESQCENQPTQKTPRI